MGMAYWFLDQRHLPDVVNPSKCQSFIKLEYNPSLVDIIIRASLLVLKYSIGVETWAAT